MNNGTTKDPPRSFILHPLIHNNLQLAVNSRAPDPSLLESNVAILLPKYNESKERACHRITIELIAILCAKTRCCNTWPNVCTSAN